MAKIFRPSTRESSILSKIESSKEYERRQAIKSVRECINPLSNAIAMKLIENSLVETTNKDGVEDQIRLSLEKMSYADDFDVDYQIAPFRNLVAHPHVVSLYLTAFVIEKLIDFKDVIDIFGSDEEIYYCINKQIARFLP
ncbi:MAG: hypothetical protein GY795_43755 [Desulfobacterales bacterium]|nr:hypothetical protein [Desulfobacterales bacterium]